MNRGDIVEFKRKGLMSLMLGGLLKILTPSWDFYGWHLSIAWDKGYDGWYILEATAPHVEINYYTNKVLSEQTRCWTWLEKPPEKHQMGLFLQQHIDRKYDVAVYFWTGFAVIIRHFWNRRIPKLLDNSFTCWELVAEFCAEMGKPIVSKYDVIIVTDIIKVLKVQEKK